MSSAANQRTAFVIGVEPRFNEVAGDRPNLFVKWRVRYIEYLHITNLRGNDQNVRYIEVVVNDWFLTQSGDFCGNTIVPMSMTYNKLLTEKLLSLDHYHNDFTLRICWLLICSAFICCCVLYIQLVDNREFKARFRRRTSHEPNRMLMRENKGFFSFAFDSAHVKYGVWTWPELGLRSCYGDAGDNVDQKRNFLFYLQISGYS